MRADIYGEMCMCMCVCVYKKVPHTHEFPESRECNIFWKIRGSLLPSLYILIAR